MCFGFKGKTNTAQAKEEGAADRIARMQENSTKLERCISVINENTYKIEALYADYLMSVVSAETSALSEQISEMMRNNYVLIRQTSTDLAQLRPIMVLGIISSTEDRIQNNIYNMVLRKLQAAVIEFQELQQRYKQKEVEKVRREIQIKFPLVTEREITQILNDAL